MTTSDHIRDRDTRGSALGTRAIRENESWQRTDPGRGGRHAGREYYDDRRPTPLQNSYDPVRPSPGAAGRALKVAGLIVAIAGLAGWLWMILALVSSVGAGTLPDDPWGTRLAGIPLGSGGFIAIVAGCVLAMIGSWLARSAYRRR